MGGEMPHSPGRGSKNTPSISRPKSHFAVLTNCCSRRVRRRVLEHDRDLDDDLPAGLNDGKVVESEKAARVGERVRDRSPVVFPVRFVAHVGKVGAGLVEIVPDGDAVQIVQRALIVDDRARFPFRARLEQHRDLQGVREWHADRRGGSRALLVDLLDRDEQIPAALPDAAARAVGEPDLVLVNVVAVARHVSGVENVVENDQPAGAAGSEKVEVGGERIRLGEVLDRAVAVDFDARRRIGIDVTVDDAVGEVGAGH
jgi:hypothetical protein